MGLAIDWAGQVVQVTSPTVVVTAQELHDFVEDAMASPEGLTQEDILLPEGKIEDPGNPGVYSQIILVFNSPWQVQFWGGSGYTQIIGGKLVGGLADEVLKATGTAGDISVLVSPVDGITVIEGGGAPTAIEVADAVWNEVGPDHITPGTTGWHQALSAYEGAVWLDEKNGTAGTTPGQHGTKASPVDTLAAAVTLLASALLSGLRQLNIRQTTGGPLDLSVAGDWDQFLFMGVGESGDISIDPTGVDIDGSEFHNITMTGDAGGYGYHAHHCLIEDLSNIGNANFGHCRLRGLIQINGTATPHFHGCMSQELIGASPPEIRLVGGTASYVHIQDYHGELQIGGLSLAGDKLEIQATGEIEILNTNTDGRIELSGVGYLDNESAGTVVDTRGWLQTNLDQNNRNIKALLSLI